MGECLCDQPEGNVCSEHDDTRSRFRRLLDAMAEANDAYRTAESSRAAASGAALKLSAAVDDVVDYLQGEASDWLQDVIDAEEQ